VLDAPLDLSIIRPTSGADETENSLVIKELEEVAARNASVQMLESTAVKKAVDSRL